MRARHGSRFVLSLLLGGLLLGNSARAARAVTVEQIPTPRPTGWAVDLTGTLTPERLAELSQLGDQVKETTGAEMAVVVVSSTDGADAHAFATRLFNSWRISDNGLLIFAALADRKVEIVLGRSLRGETGRRVSAAVMQEEMVPRFRAGNPTGAIVMGAIGCARRILGVSPIVTGLESTPETAFSSAPAPQPEPIRELPARTPPRAPAAPSEDETPLDWIGTPGLIGLGALASYLFIAGTLTLRIPRCSKCKQKMTQLDEQADDAYLEAAEKVEERIGSVDHQVWECPACGERKKRRGMVFFSSFRKCPECGAQTLSSTSTTVQVATYSYGGLIETQEVCANCSYKNSYTSATPMLEDPASSSSSSSPSSQPSYSFAPEASSPSSSSSDSSSGSGAGFSGGSSSGEGASGSW